MGVLARRTTILRRRACVMIEENKMASEMETQTPKTEPAAGKKRGTCASDQGMVATLGVTRLRCVKQI